MSPIVLAGVNVLSKYPGHRGGKQECKLCGLNRTALLPYDVAGLKELYRTESAREISRRLSEYYQVPIYHRSVLRHRKHMM